MVTPSVESYPFVFTVSSSWCYPLARCAAWYPLLGILATSIIALLCFWSMPHLPTAHLPIYSRHLRIDDRWEDNVTCWQSYKTVQHLLTPSGWMATSIPDSMVTCVRSWLKLKHGCIQGLEVMLLQSVKFETEILTKSYKLYSSLLKYEWDNVNTQVDNSYCLITL